jgi:hypothetical protein
MKRRSPSLPHNPIVTSAGVVGKIAVGDPYGG